MTQNYGSRDTGGPPEAEHNSNGSGSSGGGGGMSEEEKLYKFRFKISEPAKNLLNIPGKDAMPATNRVLMLSAKAFKVYEHSLYKISTRHFNTMCLVHNKIDMRECPICSPKGGDKYASFNGFFTVINMGQIEYFPDGKFNLHHRQWTDRSDKIHVDAFPRMLLVARWGTNEHPGQLRMIESEMARLGGSLLGTVWDITRRSKQTEVCGDNWRYIETIKPENFETYLQRYEAKDVNTQEVDYYSVVKPLSYEELEDMVGWRSQRQTQTQTNGHQQQEQQQASRAEGAGYNDSQPSHDNTHQQPQQQTFSPQQGGPAIYSDVPSPDYDDIPF